MPRSLEKNMSTWQASFPEIDPAILKVYQPAMEAYAKQFSFALNGVVGSTTDTSAVIMAALTSARPKIRYLVGVDAHALSFLKCESSHSIV